MKLRTTCYSSNDLKFICTNCGDRFFSSSTPYKDELPVSCPNCGKMFTVNFSEKKKWYGGYDGKSNIYDCFYCNDFDQYELVQKELSEVFPDAKMSDASDGIHGQRVSITVRENLKEYRKGLLISGWALHSINFNHFMQTKVKEAKALLEECKPLIEKAQEERAKLREAERKSFGI